MDTDYSFKFQLQCFVNVVETKWIYLINSIHSNMCKAKSSYDDCEEIDDVNFTVDINTIQHINDEKTNKPESIFWTTPFWTVSFTATVATCAVPINKKKDDIKKYLRRILQSMGYYPDLQSMDYCRDPLIMKFDFMMFPAIFGIENPNPGTPCKDPTEWGKLHIIFFCNGFHLVVERSNIGKTEGFSGNDTLEIFLEGYESGFGLVRHISDFVDQPDEIKTLARLASRCFDKETARKALNIFNYTAL